MTREELKEHCEKQIEMCEFWAISKGEKPSGKVYEEHKLILELLEQEPCKNTISRQAAIDIIERWLSCDDYNKAERHIMRAMQSVLYDLPSVNSQPKIGHWIPMLPENADEEMEQPDSQCSQCGYEVDYWSLTNYCPNCGAKMVEPKERSSKE